MFIYTQYSAIRSHALSLFLMLYQPDSIYVGICVSYNLAHKAIFKAASNVLETRQYRH